MGALASLLQERDRLLAVVDELRASNAPLRVRPRLLCPGAVSPPKVFLCFPIAQVSRKVCVCSRICLRRGNAGSMCHKNASEKHMIPVPGPYLLQAQLSGQQEQHEQ